ncbi:MAG: Fe-S-containing hydro-lyase [Candidatus Cloacimonetes bacterium]|nr:Fe-S-containing hydro-lyase [Candidatus Cloacimonadota bacterium]
MTIKIHTPLTDEQILGLQIGDEVLLSGTIYTARDAAHKKLIETLKDGEEIPFEIQNSIIYYTGPTPARPQEIIGSAGPTTSGRMDAYTPKLLQQGLKGMIGKGERNREVIDAIMEHRAIYFVAIGGAGVLLANAIIKSEVIAWLELGTEALRKLELQDFPCIVAIDAFGRNIFDREEKE